jgi:aldehyde dehydrogenase (NAD+)
VQPTVGDGLDPGHRLAQEEVFGPICVVLPATDEAEAVRLANQVRYGLVTSIFSRDLDHVLGLLDEVDTGLVKVNAPATGVDFYLPFGGEKDSSFGPREQGKAARELYTTTRTVAIAPASAARLAGQSDAAPLSAPPVDRHGRAAARGPGPSPPVP